MSSRTAVCGQPPVSTAAMRSGASAWWRVRNSASSRVKMSLVDDGDVVVVAQGAAQRQQQRGLAAADGSADADGESAGVVVTLDRRGALLERAGAVRIAMGLAGDVVHGEASGLRTGRGASRADRAPPEEWRGVYGDPILPDFMVFLNWKALPWFWYGFDHFWFAALMVVLVPGLLALAFGWLAFRSRVTGVYLSIITQALSYALMLAFFRNDMGFGGNNGFTDFKDILGFPLGAPSTRVSLFVATLAALAASYALTRALLRSKAGRVIRAIRDGESRTRFLGYSVESYKLWLFVVSAVIAGVAGALYVPQVGIIKPGEFAPINSIEVVIWVAVGGRGTLYGAVAGALLVNYAKTYFTGALPEVWLYALGALFILTTLLLPKGLVGLRPAEWSSGRRLGARPA